MSLGGWLGRAEHWHALSGRLFLSNGAKGDTLPDMAASDKVTFDAISPAQSRAARGLLDWSRDQLAAVSQVAKRTIVRFEASDGVTRPGTTTAIRIALEAAGVEFTNGDAPGVRLKPREPVSP